jgi:glycosyltransferase involved in cell wall biosynthesis
VVTYHNDLLAPGLRGAAFRLYNGLSQPLVVRQAARLIVTSHDYACHSFLSVADPLQQEVVEVPNGVDRDVFHPAHEADGECLAVLGVPTDRPVVLFVGAMDRAHFFKGIPILLRALSQVPDVHAVLVGDGDERQALHAMAERAVPGRTYFTGSVSLPRLINLYQNATVTVLPSTTRGEAFGMVLLESLACGTPVIASALPGVRTVVSDEVDGYLVPPGDPTALARAIDRVCSSTTDRIRMGASGRSKIVARYTWDSVGQRLEQVYLSVLSGRTTPARVAEPKVPAT